MSNYYAFGWEIEPLSWSIETFKFGYNGQEHSDITPGNYTAKYWEYDSRIGKRWNLDPIVYPWQSGYSVNNNNPIFFSDPFGLEGGPGKGTKAREGTGYSANRGGVWTGEDITLDEIEITADAPKKAGRFLRSAVNNYWQYQKGGFMFFKDAIVGTLETVRDRTYNSLVYGFYGGIIKSEYDKIQESGFDGYLLNGVANNNPWLTNNIMAFEYFANLSQKKFSEAGYFGAMLGLVILDGFSGGGGKWSAGVKGGGNLARTSIVKNIPKSFGGGVWKSGNLLKYLQSNFGKLAEKYLLPEYKAIDPTLKSGYTGSFKTGKVGNPEKSTYGMPINLNEFDIDFWIESDVLYKMYGSKKPRANVNFRTILSNTPGFEGLKPNKRGFSIKFKPHKK